LKELNMNRVLVAVAAVVFTASCAHAPAKAEPAKAPTGITAMKPKAPGASLVVVYRNVTGFFGMGGGMLNTTLYVDQKPVGDLSHDEFGVIEVPAGEHMVTVRSGMGESNLPITVAAGDSIFAQMETSPAPKLAAKPRSLAEKEIETDCSLAFNRSLVAPAPAPADGATRL
jgi:hypothetical protein